MFLCGEILCVCSRCVLSVCVCGRCVLSVCVRVPGRYYLGSPSGYDSQSSTGGRKKRKGFTVTGKCRWHVEYNIPMANKLFLKSKRVRVCLLFFFYLVT